MTTRSVSYVKAHLAEVIDHESYQRTRETLAMLKLVAMGVHEIEHGRTVTQARVFKDARSRLERRLTEQGHG